MSRATARKPEPRPMAAPTHDDGDDLPEGISRLSEILDGPMPKISARSVVADRIAYRLEEIADMLGVSRSTIERERRKGRFPRPDLHIGRMPLWRPETIRQWVENGGGR